MEQTNRKTIFDDLNKYCHLADKHATIEITEWTNGEGIDITLTSKPYQVIPLTWGELEAIKTLTKKIEQWV